MSSLGRILDRYVGGKFASTYGLVLLGFLALFVVIDFVGSLDDLRKGAEHLGRPMTELAVSFYSAKLPGIVSAVGPYITLFAGIATVISLTRHNELVPMLSAGRSVHRVLLPVYVGAVILVGVLVLVEESLVPMAHGHHQTLDRALSRKRGRPVEVPHLRDALNAFATDGWVPGEQALLNVRCPQYTDPSGNLPSGALQADRLLYRRHPVTGLVDWYPEGGRIEPRELDAEGRPQLPVDIDPGVPLGLSLTPAEVEVLAERDEPKLYRRQLEILIERYPANTKLHLELLGRRTRPLSSLVLLLLGLPLVLRSGQRSVATGLGVALLTSMGYFAVDVFFHELGGRGALRPIFAAWAAPAFFSALAIARLDTME